MYYDERDHMNFNDNLEIELENKEINNIENNFKNFENKKWDNDFIIDINNLNVTNYRNNENILYEVSEGLNKGNMFKNSYKPYKNYIYKVVVKGEKDSLLLKIQELTFKMIDLNLYLDTNPNDQKIFNEFKMTSSDLKKHKELYEKKYGPLCMEQTSYYSSYMWNKNPWPWMNEGGIM